MRKRLKRKNLITKRNKKQKTLLVFFISVIFALFMRTAYIYVVYGDQYRQRVTRQQVYGRHHIDRSINPNRGNIVDRNGQPLAISHTVYTIFLDARELAAASEVEIELTVNTLYEIFDIEPQRVLDYIKINPETERPNRDTHFLVLKRQVSPLEEGALRDANLRHVHSEADTLRTYPIGSPFAPIIGFLSGDNNHWGLEGAYNHFLTGSPGRRVRMFNPSGVVTTNDFRPTTGYTLVTTLDLGLMNAAAEVAQNYGSRYRANVAQVIIMNPNTGEVLAMAQYPSFNNNQPFNIDYITSRHIQAELTEKTEQERINRLFNVWSNKAISHSFEPGSIFKPIIHAAALEEGVTYPGEQFFCPGFLYVSGVFLACWHRPGHGVITLEESIAISCNIVSMILGERLGRQTFYDYLQEFGIGQLTGIDLIGEASVFPLTYSLNQLNPVEIATSSFGQGFNMTAIQMMMAFSAVINGGNVLVPYIVSQVTDGENIIQENERIIRRNVISQNTSDFWRDTMVKTLEWGRGTGTGARIYGFNIGGKTGTAQQGVREEEEHVYSFIGYLPANNPQYIVMVSLDRPNFTQMGSAPIHSMLRSITEQIILQRGIELYNTENITTSPMVSIEDYSGKTLMETIRRLQEKGLIFELIGNGGTVINQQPLAGSNVVRGTTVILYLSDEYYEGSLVLVPNFSGMELGVAIEAVNTFGLDFITIYINQAEIYNNETQLNRLTGTVVNQLPQPGVRIPKSTVVTLIIE